MARLGFTFDSSNQQGQDTNDVLPAGDYLMQVVQSEVRATKDGSGQYVWLEFDILDGEHQGRKYWERLNIWNANPTAAEIANRALTSLTRACGMVAIDDTEDLHFKPIKVRMGVSKAELLVPLVEGVQPVIQTALVVGGGFAGSARQARNRVGLGQTPAMYSWDQNRYCNGSVYYAQTLKDSTLDIELWAGKSDLLLRQVKAHFNLNMKDIPDQPGASALIDFLLTDTASKVNQPVTITAPQ